MIGWGRHLVADGTPTAEFLARLQSILESEKTFKELAGATLDPRLSIERWSIVLRVELLMLLKWALCRYRNAIENDSFGGSISSNDPLLILLPGYGFCLHTVRRAMPFAALGVETTISVPDNAIALAAKGIMPILFALGVEELVSVSNELSKELVRKCCSKRQHVCLTGRRSTFDEIIEAYPNARLLGATGGCSVIISPIAGAAAELELAIAKNHIGTSCSNHGLTIISEACHGSARIVSMHGPRASASVRSVADAILSAHPSIILAPENEEWSADIPTTICDYRVVECSLDGEPASREYFARDPICGWPGDWAV